MSVIAYTTGSSCRSPRDASSHSRLSHSSSTGTSSHSRVWCGYRPCATSFPMYSANTTTDAYPLAVPKLRSCSRSETRYPRPFTATVPEASLRIFMLSNSEKRLTNASDRKKKMLNAASHGDTITPAAADPARIRIVYRPESTITSTSTIRFRRSEYAVVVTA